MRRSDATDARKKDTREKIELGGLIAKAGLRYEKRALLLGLLGGIVGLAGASAMQALSISTTNFQTFAEIAFSFTMTPGIVAASLVFALAMGFVGGFLPAARAARMKIVDALRAA